MVNERQSNNNNNNNNMMAGHVDLDRHIDGPMTTLQVPPQTQKSFITTSRTTTTTIGKRMQLLKALRRRGDGFVPEAVTTEQLLEYHRPRINKLQITEAEALKVLQYPDQFHKLQEALRNKHVTTNAMLGMRFHQLMHERLAEIRQIELEIAHKTLEADQKKAEKEMRYFRAVEAERVEAERVRSSGSRDRTSSEESQTTTEVSFASEVSIINLVDTVHAEKSAVLKNGSSDTDSTKSSDSEDVISQEA